MDLPAALLGTLLAGVDGLPAEPPLSDLARLPPRAVADGWVGFAEACDRAAAARQAALGAEGLAGGPEWERLARLREAVECRAVAWRLLRWAQDPCEGGHARRWALRNLWERTTWDEYYNGALPPPVPLHLFAEMP